MSHILNPIVLRLGSVGALFGIFAQCAWPVSVATAQYHTLPKPIKEAAEAKEAEKPSRTLSLQEMEKRSGRWAGNPYYAGTAKFDKVVKGVNLRTGNFTMSATDLNFEGGYGIPVSLSRTFSANAMDEGPLGPGWSLSIDVRSTVGAVSNSSQAPSMSVPANFKERPVAQDDPNVPVDPVEAVLAVDDSGETTTIQKDVDGVLTTPPWDKNNLEPTYETIFINGQPKQILTGNKCITPEGTVYIYQKKGSFNGGVRPWNNATATPEQSNILKVTSVTDRHGNTTTYQYGGTLFTYQKNNGTATEYPVTGIAMPNGRAMTFTYSGNRLATATDGTRTVTYGYTSSRLTSVTSPGGRITRYGWGPTVNNSMVQTINSITDPRGQVTLLSNAVGAPNSSTTVPEGLIYCYGMKEPSGKKTYFTAYGIFYPVSGESSPPAFHLPPSWWSPGVIEYTDATLPHALTFSLIETSQIGSTIVTTDRQLYAAYMYTFMTLATETKRYSAETQDCFETETSVAFVPLHGRDVNWNFAGYSNRFQKARSQVTTNFLGHPLREVTTKWEAISGATTNLRTFTKEYAYWGEDKYFQEKAQRVQVGSGWRYSFKDYNDKSDSKGKGQVKEIYDAKHGNIELNTSLAVPDFAVQGGYAWRYQVLPRALGGYQNPNSLPSATFTYDTYGRVETVRKLQNVNIPYIGVYTTTTSGYGSNNAPEYGNAIIVTEDVGGINRTTRSLEFDVAGRAIKTMDGMNRTFQKTYDGDGNLLQVSRINGSVSTPLATTVYGSTDGTPENGSPISVLDEQSGVSQSISYIQSGVHRGLPLTHSTVDGTVSDATTYIYTPEGYREAVTLQTPNGTTRTKYSGFIELGMAGSSTPAPTRIIKQAFVSGTWQDTDEQIQYRYLPDGRIFDATFAKTPQSGQTGYDSYPAQTQARAVYDYNSLGGIASIKYWWEILQGGGIYSQTPIFAADATYGHVLGLKDSQGFFNPNGAGFTLQRRENYAYDSQTDFLTEVDYNDGQAHELQTWGYDAAGNRTSASANPGSWSYDNLNRMVSSPFGSYTHDLAGNRLSGPSQALTWDTSNRLIGLNGVTHRYRADGMRVHKAAANGDTYRWHYDAQMPIEETRVVGGQTTVMRNIVGPRGVDVQFAGSSVSYPIYDTHGNTKALLARSGSSFTTFSWRQYDVWGSMRPGSTLGGASQRYCASLGHVTDDESGLIYMRARFYEPGTGRFISQDSALDGINWYIYCQNSPIVYSDPSGNIFAWVMNMLKGMPSAIAGALLGYWIFGSLNLQPNGWEGATFGGIAGHVLQEISHSALKFGVEIFTKIATMISESKWAQNALKVMSQGDMSAKATWGAVAIAAVTMYSILLMVGLLFIFNGGDDY